MVSRFFARALAGITCHKIYGIRNVIEISEEKRKEKKQTEMGHFYAYFMCFYKGIEHGQCSTKHILNRLIKSDENNHNYIFENSGLDYYYLQ